MLRSLYTKIFFIISFFGVYAVSTIYQSDFWGNILSPLTGLFTFLIIYKNAKEENKKDTYINQITWLCLSLACLSWVIGDILWSLCFFTSSFKPAGNIIIELFYYCSNISLFASVIIFCINTFKKWNTIQLLTDSIFITISSILLLWVLHNNSTFLNIIVDDSYITILIAIDMVILVAISICFLYVKKGTTPIYITLIAIGIVIFTTVDLFYLHLRLDGSYIPNSITDSAYMSGFIMIAIGALYKKHLCDLSDEIIIFSNFKFYRKGLFLLIYPFVIFLLRRITVPIFINYLVIIFTREFLSIYIQASIKNEQLLMNEKKMNLILEEKIIERTKEITEKNLELEAKNKELDYLSNKDTLTNLYNRRFFMENLKNKIETLDYSEKITLFYIDVDRFKTINDMYGHQVGDEALIEVSKRLEKLNSMDCISARLGGDEFVLAYCGIFSIAEIEELAEVIIRDMENPIEIGEYIFHVSASMGISIYPIDAKDSYTLIKNGDIAMYEAKCQGKNRYVFFDTKFKDSLNRKNQIENLLKKADYNNEFELYYQPQFNIPDKNLIGIEALLRWNNSTLGSISPSEFIPIAEEIDCINSIGEWVMEKAIKQIEAWNKDYSYRLKIGINVSPKQLDNKNFVPKLKEYLKTYDVLPENIDIEITESIAIEGEYKIKQIESLFDGLGVSISIDDFGTGYSSLSYLRIFPFERIKIAKPLIDVISTDLFDFQIVKSIIKLAKSIVIKTIAEGVEFQEQLDILTELGCDEMQGYLLGKPMPAEQFEKMYLLINHSL